MSAIQGSRKDPAMVRPRAIPSAGMARLFGANAVVRSAMSEMEVARSARTRRPVTCGRLEVGRSQNGIVGMGNLFRYRVESVRHDTSPSCRDLRTARSCVSKRQPRRIHVADACPCTPRPLGLVHHARRDSFATSLVCAWRERDARDPAWRRSDKELPFPYCYGFCSTITC